MSAWASWAPTDELLDEEERELRLYLAQLADEMDALAAEMLDTVAAAANPLLLEFDPWAHAPLLPEAEDIYRDA